MFCISREKENAKNIIFFLHLLNALLVDVLAEAVQAYKVQTIDIFKFMVCPICI